MGLQQQTLNEWKFWPEREDAVLRSQTALGVYDSYPLIAPGGAIKRRSITWREMTASGGAYTNRDRAWLVPSANLPDGVFPKPGDQIRDGGDVDWTVGDVTVGKFGNTYKCIGRALSIVEGLSALGVLTRPDNTQDAAGRMALSTYSEVARVKCRVQPQDSDAGDHWERRTTARKFTAYLDAQLQPRAKDVFTVTSYVSPGGAISGVQAYTVLGFRNPERIWDLMSLDLELIA